MGVGLGILFTLGFFKIEIYIFEVAHLVSFKCTSHSHLMCSSTALGIHAKFQYLDPPVITMSSSVQDSSLSTAWDFMVLTKTVSVAL